MRVCNTKIANMFSHTITVVASFDNEAKFRHACAAAFNQVPFVSFDLTANKLIIVAHTLLPAFPQTNTLFNLVKQHSSLLNVFQVTTCFL